MKRGGPNGTYGKAKKRCGHA